MTGFVTFIFICFLYTILIGCTAGIMGMYFYEIKSSTHYGDINIFGEDILGNAILLAIIWPITFPAVLILWGFYRSKNRNKER